MKKRVPLWTVYLAALPLFVLILLGASSGGSPWNWFGTDIRHQGATDSVTGVQVLDNDGGTPIWNVDTVNERVGIGIAAPTVALDVVGTINATALTATSMGLGNEVLDTYDEGSYTATGTGFVSDPTVTSYFVIVGKQATVYFPNISGTSDATTFTITGLPAVAHPARDQQGAWSVVDNASSRTMAWWELSTSGVFSLFSDLNANAFTASGTKTLVRVTVSYLLN